MTQPAEQEHQYQQTKRSTQASPPERKLDPDKPLPGRTDEDRTGEAALNDGPESAPESGDKLP